MLVATLAHEVMNALVHGDACGSNQAWHAGDDAMVARGNHVRTGTQDGDELEHVMFVGSEDRRAGQKLQHGTASMRIEPLHRDKDGEDAMALAEGGRSFAKSRDVAAVFFVHLVARLMEIHGAVLAFLAGAGRGARDVF